ncbi:MAG: hypothetical protein J0L56_13475 [Chitinophagales bacterium]|nr:hypothetical protein [Chitinophagales bacterium]
MKHFIFSLALVLFFLFSIKGQKNKIGVLVNKNQQKIWVKAFSPFLSFKNSQDLLVFEDRGDSILSVRASKKNVSYTNDFNSILGNTTDSLTTTPIICKISKADSSIIEAIILIRSCDSCSINSRKFVSINFQEKKVLINVYDGYYHFFVKLKKREKYYQLYSYKRKGL